MIEMTNKNLSELFGVNFAKWKRWNREFIECYEGSETERGYLKKYTPEEAFTVMFGGYLVYSFRFSIQEAKTILGDLLPWILNRFFQPKKLAENSNKTWVITIEKGLIGFSYEIKGIISTEKINKNIYTETYISKIVNANNQDGSQSFYVLNIGNIFNNFNRGIR